MPNSQNVHTVASPEQLAANRANAAKSTGPRSPEGKARSAQNARKHGFAAEAYAVVRLEDLQEVAHLKDDAAEVYRPVNSQEMFAVERIAITQQTLLRAARLEAGLFTSCLSDVYDLREMPAVPMADELVADLEVARAQNRNFLVFEGLKRLAVHSNAFSLFLRYSAQAERQYRRAVDEFDRLKALRPELSGADLQVCVPADLPIEPNPPVDGTNPMPPEPAQNAAPLAPPAAFPRPIDHPDSRFPSRPPAESRTPPATLLPPSCEN